MLVKTFLDFSKDEKESIEDEAQMLQLKHIFTVSIGSYIEYLDSMILISLEDFSEEFESDLNELYMNGGAFYEGVDQQEFIEWEHREFIFSAFVCKKDMKERSKRLLQRVRDRERELQEDEEYLHNKGRG